MKYKVDYKYIDGALLRKPEPKRGAADRELIQKVAKQDARAIRHDEPNREQAERQTDRRRPIPFCVYFFIGHDSTLPHSLWG